MHEKIFIFFFFLRHLNFIISELFIILAVGGFSISFVEGTAVYVVKGNGGSITTVITVIGSPLLTSFLSVTIACLSSGQNLGHRRAILGFEVKVV